MTRAVPAVTACFASFALGCGDTPELEEPAPLFGEAPIEYPLPLWDEGVEGTTLVRVRVDEAGAVDSAIVVESSGHPGLDSAAVLGARELRFEPARRGGERVAVWAQLPVRFSRAFGTGSPSGEGEAASDEATSGGDGEDAPP